VRITRFASISSCEPPAWPEWVPKGNRRRMDALNRLVCATTDRLLDAGMLPEGTAVVVANSYGSVDSTLRFVLSINDFGDQSASPTPFTTSVHNSSAGVLGELLHLHGPCTTISQGGTGGLPALRWAALMLGAQRAPAVLAVIGDKHVAWSRDIVGKLSESSGPSGDGAAACLLEPGEGPGRELRMGRHAASRCLDGGALLAEDEAVLADRACEAHQRRLRAPDLLGSWWPCCLLAALPFDQPDAVQLREIEQQQVMEAWMGPAG
jgi:hypothetical protein